MAEGNKMVIRLLNGKELVIYEIYIC